MAVVDSLAPWPPAKAVSILAAPEWWLVSTMLDHFTSVAVSRGEASIPVGILVTASVGRPNGGRCEEVSVGRSRWPIPLGQEGVGP